MSPPHSWGHRIGNRHSHTTGHAGPVTNPGMVMFSCCSLSCPTASPGRDAAWFVGDVESHTFTKYCATHLDGPRTTVPSSSSFVFWSSGERMVRVEAYRPDSGQFEHVGDRAVPADVTAVFGIFDDDSSILAVTGFSANPKLIEIGLQSEVVPSRFGSMPGFFLQAVRQGPDGGTYAFGIDDVTQTVIKRSEREKNQTHYHHLPAVSFERVLAHVKARYVVGLCHAPTTRRPSPHHSNATGTRSVCGRREGAGEQAPVRTSTGGARDQLHRKGRRSRLRHSVALRGVGR